MDHYEVSISVVSISEKLIGRSYSSLVGHCFAVTAFHWYSFTDIKQSLVVRPSQDYIYSAKIFGMFIVSFFVALKFLFQVFSFLAVKLFS